MKVSLKKTEKGYTATFEIETKEDSIRFHDDVAIKITHGPHAFIGNVFNRSHNIDSEDTTYDI